MWKVDYSDATQIWWSQIPLTLGWAYSAHRVRGMTFDRVCVNMRELSNFCQTYEIISKVKNLAGIQFKMMNWSYIKVHPKCAEYYNIHNDEWEALYQKEQQNLSSPHMSKSKSSAVQSQSHSNKRKNVLLDEDEDPL